MKRQARLSSVRLGKSPRNSFDSKKGGNGNTAMPGDFITYLRTNQDPVRVEVGRLHKLRILLRNETVAWVDLFVGQDGVKEIVGLLYRIMEIEWREEHEDCLLHETLLCLKGLCTTEKAMLELESMADELFPRLTWMLYDEEKKGPAEYSTRAIVTSILCEWSTESISPKHRENADENSLVNFLASAKDGPAIGPRATRSSHPGLRRRAHQARQR